MDADLAYRKKSTWDIQDNRTKERYRIVYIYAIGQDKPIAQAEINVRVITAPEWESDRIVKSIDTAYIRNGHTEIEYFDESGRLCADTLPPLSRLFILTNGKSIEIKEDKEYAA